VGRHEGGEGINSEAELKKLEAKAVYWEKLLAATATAISKSRKVSFKDATAVIHSRKMLNKIAVHCQQQFKYEYWNQRTNQMTSTLDAKWTPGYGDLKNARNTKEYLDTKGKSLKDFFTEEEWLELDILNRDVNGHAHDYTIPNDPVASKAHFRIVVPDTHYDPELYKRILLRCGVGKTEDDIEIQKASNESPAQKVVGRPRKQTLVHHFLSDHQ
jgi:hypothetical protein